MLLAVLTADSAWPFACWWPGLLVLCSEPLSLPNWVNSEEVNCGPLSEITTSGVPFLAKWLFSFHTHVDALVSLSLSISQKLDKQSTVMRQSLLSRLHMSTATFSHGLSVGSWVISVSLACLAECWLHISCWVMCSFISALMLGQNRHLRALLRHPLISKWELCSCFMVW